MDKHGQYNQFGIVIVSLPLFVCYSKSIGLSHNNTNIMLDEQSGV